MSFANLSRLAQQRPLRLLLVNAGEADAITWAGLVQPLRLAARELGPELLQLELRDPQQAVAGASAHSHLVLLVADERQAPLRTCRRADRRQS